MFTMKHATSRFFRFFLVAALVAAMVGSLLPAKVAGQATPSITATPSSMATAEPVSWTINVTGIDLLMDTDPDTADNQPSEVTLTFSGVTLAAPPGDATMTNSGSLIMVDGTALAAGATIGGTTIVFPTPVATTGGSFTITIASHYLDDAATDATDESETAISTNAADPTGTNSVDISVNDVDATATTTPATADGAEYATYDRPNVVSPTSLRAGQSAEWEVTSTQVLTGNDLVANADRISVSFSSGTVPSGISRDDILVRAGTAAERLSVAPTVSSRTISFLSPIAIASGDVTDANPVRIIISSTVGIAAGNSPGGIAVTVKLGTNTAAVSMPVMVNPYLNISPRSAPRNTTVTVTGGGFTAGTSGGILVDGSGTGGTYTVDSSGVLTGSFVASAGTAGGGVVSVLDLGRGGEPVMGPSFTQLPSATPASTEVARGASVGVTLSDFPGTGDYSATVGGAAGSYFSTTNDTSGRLTIPQGETTGTKQVVVSRGGGTASFLITVVGRTLTVSPSSAVPGQPITVSGTGFTASSEGGVRVNLTLGGMDIDDGQNLRVNTDGSFLYTGKVPFADNDDLNTSSPGSKTWTATETSGARAATSSGFTIQKRSITLSPSTANPGATVEVFGSGFGVTTRLDVTSQVTLTLSTNPNTTYGPFPIGATGEFTGAVTVPSDAQVTSITVTATDNNGPAPGTAGFAENQAATATLRVPTGVISVSPDSASTGSTITVSGSGFPTQTNLSALSFGTANALPVPAPATDVNGNFTVTLTVPAASEGGSLAPGAVVITARVGNISGTTSFTIPGPEISLSSTSARPGDTLVITGSGFSAFANVSSVTIGRANQTPVPNPLTDGVGNFTANVVVPTLNPGAYTVTVRTGATFTATAPIRVLSATVGNARSPEDAFRSLTSRGILTLAAAAAPGGTSFGAYVPDLAGNTLVLVEPNGVLILTLNADARISVSGQPAVDVAADTPTFFALGSTVSIEVVE